MDTQAQATAVLHAQAGMLLFLGMVMLFAHYTSRRLKANNGAVWFALGAICGSAGLFLQSYYGLVPQVVSVIFGNALFLCEVVLLTYAVALVTQQSTRVMPYLIAATGVLVCGFAWLTWVEPTRNGRVLLAMVSLPLLLLPATILLLRTRDKVIRPATYTLAGLLLFLDAGMFARAVRVASGGQLVTGASWAGTVFIAGSALCFFWIDTLRLSAQLESQAMTDPLTSLLNRRAIETFARRELARCQRQGQAIAALMIDMDDFKSINDRHGHSVGDEALHRIGEVIQQSVRAVDLAARVGGDEFLILLPDASEIAVRAVTVRLRTAIGQIRIPVRVGEDLCLSATIGQTRSTKGDVTLQDLMRHSDQHLYEQKQKGRGGMRKVELLPLELLNPSRVVMKPPTAAQHAGPVS